MLKVSIALLGSLLAIPVMAQSNGCDVNGDGVINVVDVQLTTNMYLGTTSCTANIAGSGVCTPEVVQTVVTAALGGSCSLHYVTLNWGASTSTSIAGYNIYRGTVSGGPYTKLNTSLLSGLVFTDTTAQAGQTYFYVATAVNTSNLESSYSSPASVVVPTP
jgi:hypothetical protein